MVDKKNSNENEVFDDVEITKEDETDVARVDMEEIETETATANKIKSLQAKIKHLEGEKSEYSEQLHRTKADFLNARKRLEEEKNSALRRERQRFIESILPVCDSFSQAMDDKETWQKVDEQWRKGVEGIYGQLQSTLTAYNVKQENPIGAIFDPNVHEALSEVPVDEVDKHNTIIQVIQPGYYFDDEDQYIVRPARVTVGSYSAEN